MVRADSLFPFVGTATHTHTHQLINWIWFPIERSMRVVRIQCGNVLLMPTVRVSAPHLWTWKDNTVHFHQVLHYMQIDSSIGYARPLSCQPRAQLLGFHNFLGHCCSVILYWLDCGEPERAWASPTLESQTVDFSHIYIILYIICCAYSVFLLHCNLMQPHATCSLSNIFTLQTTFGCAHIVFQWAKTARWDAWEEWLEWETSLYEAWKLWRQTWLLAEYRWQLRVADGVLTYHA